MTSARDLAIAAQVPPVDLRSLRGSVSAGRASQRGGRTPCRPSVTTRSITTWNVCSSDRTDIVAVGAARRLGPLDLVRRSGPPPRPGRIDRRHAELAAVLVGDHRSVDPVVGAAVAGDHPRLAAEHVVLDAPLDAVGFVAGGPPPGTNAWVDSGSVDDRQT